jgi:outer membrane protein W
MALIKQFFLTAIMALLFSGMHAQFSIGFQTGYAFQAGKNSVETYVNTKEDNSSYYTQNKKFSLGGGFQLGAALTYNFHENMGVYLGMLYHFPQDVLFEEYNSVVGITAHKERYLSASRFTMLPAFQVNTAFEKLNTFMRVGLSINFVNQQLYEKTTIDTNIYEYYWEYEGKSNLGFFGQWGASYKAGENVLVELSVAYEGFQFSPDKNTMVEAKVNSRNINLNKFPEIEKSVEFEEWVSDQYNQYPDADKPLILPKQNFSYHNISLNLSLVYRF